MKIRSTRNALPNMAAISIPTTVTVGITEGFRRNRLFTTDFGTPWDVTIVI